MEKRTKRKFEGRPEVSREAERIPRRRALLPAARAKGSDAAQQRDGSRKVKRSAGHSGVEDHSHCRAGASDRHDNDRHDGTEWPTTGNDSHGEVREATREIEVILPPKCEFLFEPHRYKALYGGRGAAKSHSIARALLVDAIRTKHRVLCTREFQVSIADSVHKLLSDKIQEHGLGYFYDIQKTRITGANGSEFIFAGLRHSIESIKSMEGITRCWVEEAQRVSEESWRILIPTIRDDGSEIWASFNPIREKDPTYQRLIVRPPPDSMITKLNWQDNPWFPEALRREKDYDYSTDPDAAAHVWGGEPLKFTKSQILCGKISVEPFDPQPDWDGPLQGVDWGFSVSPTVMVRCWIHEDKSAGPDTVSPRTLYIEHEAFGVGVDIDATPALFDQIPNAKDYETRADCSRPETISHMNKHGYPRIGACAKGPGSVEDGIMHLRGYERIVIHPRCVHAEEQSRLWSWKVDRLTGAVLPVPVKLHDDVWDAARYALEPVMKGSSFFLI
jgi:phage terminase large subunit